MHRYGTGRTGGVYTDLRVASIRARGNARFADVVDWANPILAEPLRIVDGFAMTRDAAGSGLAWNNDAVERYAL